MAKSTILKPRAAPVWLGGVREEGWIVWVEERKIYSVWCGFETWLSQRNSGLDSATAEKKTVLKAEAAGCCRRYYHPNILVVAFVSWKAMGCVWEESSSWLEHALQEEVFCASFHSLLWG